MTQAEIKRKRTESILKETIPEVLSTLGDPRINTLTVTEVHCSRGRSDAKVYLDKGFLSEAEQHEALRQLKKVAHYIQNRIKESEGWFKAPKLHFLFDEHFESVSRIEALFEQIEKERKKTRE